MSNETIMTPEMLENAVLRLLPEALALIERCLHETSKPSKAALDTAWRVVDAGLDQSSEAQPSSTPGLQELEGLLQFRSGSTT